MKKILLIEDEAPVVSFIRKGLTEEGYEVSVALDGRSGLQMLKNNRFDLAIIDIMLPEINGLGVCREIRQTDKQLPILFLTALGTAENIVIGLEAGADDYLVKPFKFIELVARIKTLLRRSNHQQSVEHIYTVDDLTLDDNAKIVERNHQQLSLTTTEYRLLLYFLKNKNKVLSRVDILENVWDVNFNLSTNVVDVYVNYLRKKIENNSDNKIIQTIIGMGYVVRD